MKPVHGADAVLCKLVAQQSKATQVAIDALWQIGHTVVAILDQIGDELGVLEVVFALAVVLQFLGLLDCIRIDLHHADAVGHQPGGKAEPVMSSWLEADDNLRLAVSGSQFQQPSLG